MESSCNSAGVILLFGGAYVGVKIMGGLFFVLMQVASIVVVGGGARFSTEDRVVGGDKYSAILRFTGFESSAFACGVVSRNVQVVCWG